MEESTNPRTRALIAALTTMLDCSAEHLEKEYKLAKMGTCDKSDDPTYVFGAPPPPLPLTIAASSFLRFVATRALAASRSFAIDHPRIFYSILDADQTDAVRKEAFVHWLAVARGGGLCVPHLIVPLADFLFGSATPLDPAAKRVPPAMRALLRAGVDKEKKAKPVRIPLSESVRQSKFANFAASFLGHAGFEEVPAVDAPLKPDDASNTEQAEVDFSLPYAQFEAFVAAMLRSKQIKSDPSWTNVSHRVSTAWREAVELTVSKPAVFRNLLRFTELPVLIASDITAKSSSNKSGQLVFTSQALYFVPTAAKEEVRRIVYADVQSVTGTKNTGLIGSASSLTMTLYRPFPNDEALDDLMKRPVQFSIEKDKDGLKAAMLSSFILELRTAALVVALELALGGRQTSTACLRQRTELADTSSVYDTTSMVSIDELLAPVGPGSMPNALRRRAAAAATAAHVCTASPLTAVALNGISLVQAAVNCFPKLRERLADDVSLVRRPLAFVARNEAWLTTGGAVVSALRAAPNTYGRGVLFGYHDSADTVSDACHTDDDEWRCVNRGAHLGRGDADARAMSWRLASYAMSTVRRPQDSVEEKELDWSPQVFATNIGLFITLLKPMIHSFQYLETIFQWRRPVQSLLILLGLLFLAYLDMQWYLVPAFTMYHAFIMYSQCPTRASIARNLRDRNVSIELPCACMRTPATSAPAAPPPIPPLRVSYSHWKSTDTPIVVCQCGCPQSPPFAPVACPYTHGVDFRRFEGDEFVGVTTVTACERGVEAIPTSDDDDDELPEPPQDTTADAPPPGPAAAAAAAAAAATDAPVTFFERTKNRIHSVHDKIESMQTEYREKIESISSGYKTVHRVIYSFDSVLLKARSLYIWVAPTLSAIYTLSLVIISLALAFIPGRYLFTIVVLHLFTKETVLRRDPSPFDKFATQIPIRDELNQLIERQRVCMQVGGRGAIVPPSGEAVRDKERKREKRAEK